MQAEIFAKLRRSLIRHEGYRNFIYQDTLGNLTGGIGYNFSCRGLSDAWIDQQFQADVSFFYDSLNKNYPFFSELNADRKIILCDMAFMGLKNLEGFHKMWEALAKQDFDLASKEIIRSKWALQVGQRAMDLAIAMKSGFYDI